MSKWFDLLHECEKNKNIENPPMSVMSVSRDGNGIIFSDVNTKSDNDDFEPMSVMSVPEGTFYNNNNNNKNILKDAYRHTDKTDIGLILPNRSQPLEINTLFLNAVETILNREKPQGISEARWKAIKRRLHQLVYEERGYLLKMIDYGWSLQELFGCHKFAPDIRIDGMGILMVMTDAVIDNIKPGIASLKHKEGSITTYRVGKMDHLDPEMSTLMEIV